MKTFLALCVLVATLVAACSDLPETLTRLHSRDAVIAAVVEGAL